MLGKIQKVSSLLIALYPMAVLLSYYKLHKFLSKFGIDVYHYLTLSEMPLIFLNDITLLLVGIGFIFIQASLPIIIEAVFPSAKLLEEDERFLSEKTYRYLLIPIFVTIVYSLLWSRNSSFYSVYLVGFVCIIAATSKNHSIRNKAIISIASIVFLGFFYIEDSSIDLVTNVVKKCSGCDCSPIYLNGTKLLGDSEEIYLGQTEKFVFKYGCPDTSVRIYNLNKIE